MNTLNPQYLPAMNALNDFYEMLYEAMQTAMPTALLSKSGAYVWRGYRIDQYQNLALNQYYCQLNPTGDSHILVFKESFYDESVPGHYRDVPMGTLNFSQEGFFSRDREGQLARLTEFISTCAREAVRWQDDERRLSVVPAQNRTGYEVRRHERGPVGHYNKVTEDLLQAFPMQNRIFDLLNPAIIAACQQVCAVTPVLRANISVFNWGFRGFRMWMGEVDGACDFVWRIYYERPSMITFERNKGKSYYIVKHRFEMNHDFLSAPEAQQNELLGHFAREALSTR